MVTFQGVIAPVPASRERQWGMSRKTIEAQSKSSLKRSHSAASSTDRVAAGTGDNEEEDALVPIGETLKTITVHEHVNKKGRGPPKPLLEDRRRAEYGELLYSLGCTYPEVWNCEDMMHTKMSGDTYKTWEERLPSSVLMGGHAEDRSRIIEDFILKPTHNGTQPRNSLTKLAFDPSRSIVAMEHLERHPMARTVKGQHGTCIRFVREDHLANVPDDLRFHTVSLPTEEPSPVMFDVPEMRYFHVKGVGLSSVTPCPKSECSYYLVMDGVIYPIDDMMVIGQLEPTRMAPTPAECNKISTDLKSKTPLLSPKELGYYRGSIEYIERTHDILGKEILDQGIVPLLEAYGILKNMIFWGHEATRALYGDHTAPLPDAKTELLKALRYVIRELQLAPWNQTFFYKYLFSEYGVARSPFPDDARMSVTGFGSFHNMCVSFVPVMYKRKPKEESESTESGQAKPPPQPKENPPSNIKVIEYTPDLSIEYEYIADDTILRFRLVQSKKKRSHWHKKDVVKIGSTDKDTRILKGHSLNNILFLIGVPRERILSIKKRWDKTWIIIKMASSHKGPTILDGALMKYVRNELTTQRNNKDHAKKELVYIKSLIEKEEFFIAYREDTKGVWNQRELLNEPDRLYIPESKCDATEENLGVVDDEIDDWAMELGNEIFNESEINNKVKRMRHVNLQDYVKYKSCEASWVRDRIEWGTERKLDREGYKPKFAVRRRLVYTYKDGGVVSGNGENISVTHYLSQEHRRPITILDTQLSKHEKTTNVLVQDIIGSKKHLKHKPVVVPEEAEEIVIEEEDVVEE